MKEVYEFPNYLIDTNANLWGKKQKHYNFKRPSVNKLGYLEVSLRKDGKQYTKKLHRLVLETFRGKCPEGMQSCHNDGNPTNNKLSNLRWDTAKSNQADRVLHGTDSRGEKSGTAKLTKTNVKHIRSLIKQGLSQREIARRYGVQQAAIWCIHNKKTWRYT